MTHRASWTALALMLCAACSQQGTETRASGTASAGGVTPPAPLAAGLATVQPAPGDDAYVAEEPSLTALTGHAGPRMSFQTLDGSVIDLADSYGKRPIYLKVWASYCIPCRAQMPKFKAIQDTYGTRMTVLAVNAGIGDDVESVRTFAQKTALNMPIAIDDGRLGAWLKMKGTPVHVLIGRDGRIAFAGHQDGPALDAALQQVLAAPASAETVPAESLADLALLRVGDAVPALKLTDAKGVAHPVSAGAARRPRALLFTATWCETYLKDIEPDTAARCERRRQDVDAAAKAGQVDWQGVVSQLWTEPETLQRYLDRTGTPVSHAIDSDGTAFRSFGIRKFPAIALIDGRGRLQRIVGPDDDLQQALATLTAKRP